MTQNAQPISKISVAKVYGAIKTTAKMVEDPVTKDKKSITVLEHETPIMRLYGSAHSFRVAQSQYGDSAVFKGIFKAVNAETGQVFSSGECCLPKMIEAQLSELLGSTDAVEFAFDISVHPAKNAYGYEYRLQPLMSVKETPVIAALESKLNLSTLPFNGHPDESKILGRDKNNVNHI